MKILNAKFYKSRTYNQVHIWFTGTHVVFPTVAGTKKLALKDIKKQLHEMVDAL